jgi:hypothetical protein
MVHVRIMGLSQSVPSIGSRARAHESRQAALERALHQCGSTLDMLQHSIRSMKGEEASLWQEAKTLRVNGDDEGAADMAHQALELAADVRMVKDHRATINRQKRLIRRQQMTQMLTGVLVDTSRAMSVTQHEMAGATATIDANSDIYAKIFEDMAVIGDALDETKCDDHDVLRAPASEDVELLAILRELDGRIKKDPAIATEPLPMPPPPGEFVDHLDRCPTPVSPIADLPAPSAPLHFSAPRVPTATVSVQEVESTVIKATLSSA